MFCWEIGIRTWLVFVYFLKTRVVRNYCSFALRFKKQAVVIVISWTWLIVFFNVFEARGVSKSVFYVVTCGSKFWKVFFYCSFWRFSNHFSRICWPLWLLFFYWSWCFAFLPLYLACDSFFVNELWGIFSNVFNYLR